MTVRVHRTLSIRYWQYLSLLGKDTCRESFIILNAEFNSLFDVGIYAGLFPQASFACISKNLYMEIIFNFCNHVNSHVCWLDIKALVFFTEKVSRFRASKIWIIWWNYNCSFYLINNNQKYITKVPLQLAVIMKFVVKIFPEYTGFKSENYFWIIPSISLINVLYIQE